MRPNSLRKFAKKNVQYIRAPARNKRVWASLEQEAKQVILNNLKEALQGDLQQERQWVVVIDGQPAQRKIIEKTAQQLNVNVTIVLDFIHDFECL